MIVTDNKYGGINVDCSAFSGGSAEFKEEISKIIESAAGKELLWINISIDRSDFIPVLTSLGFEFHHCTKESLMLVKRLAQNPIVPTPKNYTVGVGAIVRDEGQLLVVKDKFSVGYKLPGGYIDANETIKDALKREVLEETGIEVEFESIVNIGHFLDGQFGVPSIYLVCTAKARTNKITVLDSSEIVEARWIDAEQFLNSEEVNNFNKSVVKSFFKNNKSHLVDQPIALRVRGEVFF